MKFCNDGQKCSMDTNEINLRRSDMTGDGVT